jgi:hypothetical protein
MLAYVSWHRPAAGVEQAAYEGALENFHASLARRPPSGFGGSAVFKTQEIPWLDGGAQGGYEDWHLLDGWSAVGVLEEAAVSSGHISAHDAIAAKAAVSTGAIYRLAEGHARLGETRVSVWVTRAAGHGHPSVEALLGDGMDRTSAGLWRRCIGLGPAPEYCLLASERPAGVAEARLPAGWSAQAIGREVLWNG